jgi:mercuric ion binding protein
MAMTLVVGLATVALPATTHAQDTNAQSRVVTLRVPEMFCGGCEAAVKMAANKVTGVKAVKTDSDKRIAEVTFDASKTTPETIAAAITKGSGFKTEVQKPTKTKK